MSRKKVVGWRMALVMGLCIARMVAWYAVIGMLMWVMAIKTGGALNPAQVC